MTFNMKVSTFSACTALIAFSVSAIAQITTPEKPTIELIELVNKQRAVEVPLQAPACGVQNVEWIQSSGPASAEITGTGPDSIALVSEPGNYQFELSCCVAEGSNNRVQRLISSPDRIGYGAKATGGAAADSFTRVTSTKNDGPGTLRAAMLASGPRWIVFDESIHGETIFLESSINVQEPDLTIDGSGAGITISPVNGGDFPLLVFRGGNSIIHGITIDGRDFRSTSMLIREGDDYWVDHVTIFGNIFDDGIGIGQGSKGDTSASDVTISNYKAFDTNYGVLGGGEDNIVNYPPYRVTIHKSSLGARDRNPKIKNFGTAHVFNNHIHSFRFSGITAGANSKIFSQNNVLSSRNANNSASAIIGNTKNGGKSGIVYTSNDLLTDSAGSRGDVRSVTSEPFSIPYSYSLMEASEVVNHVLANAGADNVNLDGQACQTHRRSFNHE